MGDRHVYWLATVLTVWAWGYSCTRPWRCASRSSRARNPTSGTSRPGSSSRRAAGRSRSLCSSARSTRRLAVVDENFISRGFGLTTTIVDANRQAVWAVRRASGPPGPLLPCRGPGARAWRPGAERAASEDRYHPTTSRLAPGRGRVAAGRGAGAVGRSRHPGHPARRAPRRSQARQQRGLAGGPSPGPGQGLRGGGCECWRSPRRAHPARDTPHAAQRGSELRSVACRPILRRVGEVGG